MISKENFIKYMTEIKNLSDTSEKVTAALKSFSSMNEFFLEKPFILLLEMIKELSHDDYDYIDYFIYELKWGENATPESVINENGQPIPLMTLDDLYTKLEKDEKERCSKHC